MIKQNLTSVDKVENLGLNLNKFLGLAGCNLKKIISKNFISSRNLEIFQQISKLKFQPYKVQTVILQISTTLQVHIHRCNHSWLKRH